MSYANKNIYKIDKSAIFQKMIPYNILIIQQWSSCKYDNIQIIIILVCNIIGLYKSDL